MGILSFGGIDGFIRNKLSGGTSGQILYKNGSTSNDLAWINVASVGTTISSLGTVGNSSITTNIPLVFGSVQKSEVTANGDIFFPNPITPPPGTELSLYVTSTSPGGYNISFDSNFVVPTGTQLSPISGSIDVLTFSVMSTGAIRTSISTTYSSSTLNTILTGAGAPASTLGNTGDIYINGTTLYGPKTSYGGWGTGVSLIGSLYGTRVTTVPNAATIIPNITTTDIVSQLNTQTSGTLTIYSPTGTPIDGQRLLFRLNTQSALTLSWAGSYTSSFDLPLPSVTTGLGKTDYIGFIYNGVSGSWQLITRAFGGF
jgi:hypothetical protein